MMTPIQVTFYAAFMVWLSQNAPDLWKKVQHQLPNKARETLNAELGTKVEAHHHIERSCGVFMRGVLARNRSQQIPVGSPPSNNS